MTTSMAANAADVTARPAPYAPPSPVYAPPPFTWTGFYLGGNIGGAWRNDNFSDTLSGLNFSNGNNNGVFIGGGQLGFNWQVSNFVLGFEWDIDGAANNNNTGTVFVPALGTIQVTSNNRWITTLAARFGVTNGPWLFYGKAGGGWVGNDDFTINNLTTGTSITASNNNTNSGWLGARASSGLSRPIGRRRSSIIILGWMIGHLLFLLGSLDSSPATLSPRATATFRW